MALKTGFRTATKNEVKISFGGRTMIHALVRISEGFNPIQIDYYNVDGMPKGTIQLGIAKWEGADACFCMAALGGARPADFSAPAGTGRIFSQWRLKS